MQFTITGVSKEQAENLRATLVAHQTGVVLDVISDEEIDYHIDGHGILAIAKFKDSSLFVEVTKHPFYVDQQMISDGIQLALGNNEPVVIPMHSGLADAQEVKA